MKMIKVESYILGAIHDRRTRMAHNEELDIGNLPMDTLLESSLRAFCAFLSTALFV